MCDTVRTRCPILPNDRKPDSLEFETSPSVYEGFLSIGICVVDTQLTLDECFHLLTTVRSYILPTLPIKSLSPNLFNKTPSSLTTRKGSSVSVFGFPSFSNHVITLTFIKNE